MGVARFAKGGIANRRAIADNEWIGSHFLEEPIMHRIGIGLLTLLLLWPAAGAADDPKDKPDKKPASPAEEYQALVKEYQDKQAAFFKAYGEAKTDEERQK